VHASDDMAFQRALDALRCAGEGSASWLDASRCVGEVIGADACAILVYRGRHNDLEVHEGHGHDPALKREYIEHYYQHDVLLDGVPFDGNWQVSTERFPERLWGNHPFFGDLLHRYRVRQIMALSLRVNDDMKAALSFHRTSKTDITSRHFVEGRLAQLTEASMAAFTQRYDMAHAFRQGLQHAFADTGSQCFLCDATGKVQPLTPQHQTPQWGALRIVAGKVAHQSPRAQARLATALMRAAMGVPSSVTLPGSERGTALRVAVQPLPAPAKLADTQALVLVRVKTRTLEQVPSAEDLEQIFGLTGTQARVLRLLCEGLAPKECATALNCSEATVRTHIAHLMLKLDCTKQSQLVRTALLLA
jgi:DNA-binding CsgD family transcriptional regulator